MIMIRSIQMFSETLMNITLTWKNQDGKIEQNIKHFITFIKLRNKIIKLQLVKWYHHWTIVEHDHMYSITDKEKLLIV